MHWSQDLKIPKKEKRVTLWIHPEGRVCGSLFLSLQNRYYSGAEEPLEVLNHEEPFLAFKRDGTDEPRFYNKTCIMRVEYPGEGQRHPEETTRLWCRLHLTDGSEIEGAINKVLPPDHSRLYDFLNMDTERFTELSTTEGAVCLVNKAYVVSATSLSDAHHVSHDGHAWQPGELAADQSIF